MSYCAFQYATRRQVFEDKSCITFEQAKEMFDSHISRFVEDLQNDLDPEMALWINMETDSDYKDTAFHWCADDFKIIDGRLFEYKMTL